MCQCFTVISIRIDLNLNGKTRIVKFVIPKYGKKYKAPHVSHDALLGSYNALLGDNLY